MPQTYIIHHCVSTIRNAVWHMTNNHYIVLYVESVIRIPQPGERIEVIHATHPVTGLPYIHEVIIPDTGEVIYER